MNLKNTKRIIPAASRYCISMLFGACAYSRKTAFWEMIVICRCACITDITVNFRCTYIEVEAHVHLQAHAPKSVLLWYILTVKKSNQTSRLAQYFEITGSFWRLCSLSAVWITNVLMGSTNGRVLSQKGFLLIVTGNPHERVLQMNADKSTLWTCSKFPCLFFIRKRPRFQDMEEFILHMYLQCYEYPRLTLKCKALKHDQMLTRY